VGIGALHHLKPWKLAGGEIVPCLKKCGIAIFIERRIRLNGLFCPKRAATSCYESPAARNLSDREINKLSALLQIRK